MPSFNAISNWAKGSKANAPSLAGFTGGGKGAAPPPKGPPPPPAPDADQDADEDSDQVEQDAKLVGKAVSQVTAGQDPKSVALAKKDDRQGDKDADDPPSYCTDGDLYTRAYRAVDSKGGEGRFKDNHLAVVLNVYKRLGGHFANAPGNGAPPPEAKGAKPGKGAPPFGGKGKPGFGAKPKPPKGPPPAPGKGAPPFGGKAKPPFPPK